MSIEHRWAPRQPAGLPVSIACRSLGLLVRGKLRNVSNGGAWVQIQPSPPLNAPVELILPGHPRESLRSYRLPAIVIRSDESGAGLMFGRVEPDMWAALLSHLWPAGAEDAEKPEHAAAGGLP